MKPGAPKGNKNASKGMEARSVTLSLRCKPDHKALAITVAKARGITLHELLLNPIIEDQL